MFGLESLIGSIFNSSLSQSNAENWSEGGSFSEQYANSVSAQDAWTDAETANKNAHYEAELNRIYQTLMSNTAHQREVKDLKAAGLNPILSAKLGGATTPAGATAQSFMNSYATGRSSSESYGSGGSFNNSYGYNNSSSSSGFQNLGTNIANMLADVGAVTSSAISLGSMNTRGKTNDRHKNYLQ